MGDFSSSRQIVTGHEDVFGVPSTNILRNTINLPSHYPLSPERWRLFVDGSRVFPHYGSVGQYTHTGSLHDLTPAQGETVVMQSAERPRYAVGFEQIASWAAQLSRELESGDRMRFGLYDDDNGWFLEHRGDHADTKTVDFVVRRAGSDTVGDENALLARPVTERHRYELRTAWYEVTRQLYRQSYAFSQEQRTELVGRTAVADGPEVGNLPLRFEVTRGGSTSALTLSAGSCSLIAQGDQPRIVRTKTHEVSITTPGSVSANTWYPEYAVRIDPDRQIVNTDIVALNVVSYGGAGDVRCTLQSHDPSNVRKAGPAALQDSDFSAPPEHNPSNSVLQETDGATVTQAVDGSGTLQSATTNPGGFQTGYGSLHASGQGSKMTRQATGTVQKRGLYGGDYAVLWIRPDDASANLVVNVTTEQDW